MITGWKQLTKTERKHLGENKIFTNYDWEQQKQLLSLDDNTQKPACWDCYFIARKLARSE